MLGTQSAQIAHGMDRLPQAVSAILRLILIPEVIGAGLLWAGMIYFWFGFDHSSWLTRAFWIFFLWSVLPFFWALYYFFVYRRQLKHQSQLSTLAVGAPS